MLTDRPDHSNIKAKSSWGNKELVVYIVQILVIIR